MVLSVIPVIGPRPSSCLVASTTFVYRYITECFNPCFNIQCSATYKGPT